MRFRSIVGAFALAILVSACAHQAPVFAQDAAVQAEPKPAETAPTAATKGQILARRLYAEVYAKTLPSLVAPMNQSVAASLRQMSTSEDITPQQRQGLEEAIAGLPAFLDQEINRSIEQMILVTGQEMDRLAEPGDLDFLVAFTNTPTGSLLLRKLMGAGVDAVAAGKAGGDASASVAASLSSEDFVNLSAFVQTPAGTRFGGLLAESDRAARPKIDAMMAANRDGMHERITAYMCDKMGIVECAKP